MSPRSQFPAARVSTSHYFLTMSRGDRIRQVSFKPWVLAAFGAIAPIVVLGCVGASAFVFFHDDMLSVLLRRQSEMQYAYEDRLASMRSQLDRVTSRQLLDQDTLEGRVHELISRQVQIENRANIISMLADQAGVSRETTSSIPHAPATGSVKAKGAGASVNPLLVPRPLASALPASASAFAPVASYPSALQQGDDKPHPQVLDQHSEITQPRNKTFDLLANADIPVDSKLRTIVGSLESQEIKQISAVSLIGAAARQTATRLRTAVAESGLQIDKLTVPATSSQDKPVGGPFVPLKADPNGSLFEREVYRLQNDFAAADKLRRLMPYLPMRKPLEGGLEVTSPFGARVDPFFGRLATHTGVDLREPQGTAVRTTASGKVTTAGWTGGYGNMIEIDHGNGLSTRYGHLSAILVSEGQTIASGSLIGRVGTTGRSTGPHLHYEVRVNGEPVDPQRFLRAGAKAIPNQG